MPRVGTGHLTRVWYNLGLSAASLTSRSWMSVLQEGDDSSREVTDGFLQLACEALAHILQTWTLVFYSRKEHRSPNGTSMDETLCWINIDSSDIDVSDMSRFRFLLVLDTPDHVSADAMRHAIYGLYPRAHACRGRLVQKSWHVRNLRLRWDEEKKTDLAFATDPSDFIEPSADL